MVVVVVSHVVGDDVLDPPQSAPVHFTHKVIKILHGPQLRVEGIRVYDVIAMKTPRPGPEYGGGIDGTYP
jgi:hypothetical protein